MRAYLSFVRTAFLGMLAYRLRYYTGILTYLFFVGVYYFIWQAVYTGHPADYQINGFTLNQMLTYIVIGWIARSSYFSNIDDDIDDLVRSGQISLYLVRPVSFQLVMIAQAIGQSLFRILFFSVPIAVVTLMFFSVNITTSASSLALFAISSLMGFMVMTCFNFLVGLLAFYLKSIDGILRAKYNLINFASGLLLPFSFFPDWLETFFNLLPFKAIAFTPLSFYIGKIPDDQILPTLLEQALWLIVLYVLGTIVWKHAAARLTLQGG
jgi:ABC-2 type transport system permease protein